MQMEVVNQIGEGAENEQQCPDPQIDRDGMLLAFAFFVRGCGCVSRGRFVSGQGLVSDGDCVSYGCCHGLLLPQIEECEDEYPHEIDEMPIQPRDLDSLITSLAVVKSTPYPFSDDAQVDHARRDVQP